MNAPINAAVDFLVAHGPTILTGGTLLLAAGALATVAQRSPATRQRAAEMTILGLVVWLVLACVPLPRHDFSRWLLPRKSAMLARDELSATVGAVVEGAPACGSVQDVETVEVPGELLIESPSQRRQDETRIAPDRIVSNRASATAPETGRLAVVARVDWRRVGALVYLAGAIGALAWLVLGQGLLWRVLQIAEPPEPWLARLFAQAAESMASCRVRPTVRLLVSRRCRRPFSCGLWRPTIVLPASHCRREKAERLRSVLLHELGHVVRGDAWGHQLFHLGTCVWPPSCRGSSSPTIAPRDAARRRHTSGN
jgi:hypothetical protein